MSGHQQEQRNQKRQHQVLELYLANLFAPAGSERNKSHDDSCHHSAKEPCVVSVHSVREKEIHGRESREVSKQEGHWPGALPAKEYMVYEIKSQQATDGTGSPHIDREEIPVHAVDGCSNTSYKEYQ